MRRVVGREGRTHYTLDTGNVPRFQMYPGHSGRRVMEKVESHIHQE